MKRREFIKYGGAVSLGASLSGGRLQVKNNVKTPVLAKDIQAYLRSLNGGWVNLENTVDTFKAGDPEVEVKGIAVAWMSYTGAINQALEMGMNMFITHEPTYYDHRDSNPAMFEIDGVIAKKRFIEDSGITILRCHDLWDRYPGIGITDAWAKFLGFSDPIASAAYMRAFDVSGRTAGDVARQVAKKVAPLGQEAVEFIGSEDTEVKRVATGCGAGTPYIRYLRELKADLAVCSDDGFVFWQQGNLAIDLGLPVIIVNHAVSEEYGMKLLADHLAEKFPTTPVKHIPQGCMYKLIHG
jgi:putative NIF3 family GTP cyclohydrolase 1 type 2